MAYAACREPSGVTTMAAPGPVALMEENSEAGLLV